MLWADSTLLRGPLQWVRFLLPWKKLWEIKETKSGVGRGEAAAQVSRTPPAFVPHLQVTCEFSLRRRYIFRGRVQQFYLPEWVAITLDCAILWSYAVLLGTGLSAQVLTPTFFLLLYHDAPREARPRRGSQHSYLLPVLHKFVWTWLKETDLGDLW